MKKTLFLTSVFILFSSVAFSQMSDSLSKNQEFKTLLGHNRPGGAYGSFSIGYSSIDGDQAILFGGKFMWIASHSIGFGFGGTGFINEYHYEPILGRDVFLTGGYGGLYIEPIIMPNFPVHISFPCLLGAGGISYISKASNNWNNMIEDSEAFLIAEPAIELELNLTRHFRFAIGTSYRFTTPFNVGLEPPQVVTSESLRSFTYMVTFKFGRF